MDLDSFLRFLAMVISLISAILIFLTINSNKKLNQRILFNEIVKQERELRIKLDKYRQEIDFEQLDNENDKLKALNYETLLFNYYEYLSICIFKKIIKEKEGKLFFKGLLKETQKVFNTSFMFEQGYSNKKQYPFLKWLFKKWRT